MKDFCKSYIDAKFTSPGSVNFIKKYFEKIGIEQRYYQEYLENLRKSASIRNRSAGVAKMILGIILLAAAVVQCMLPVIWLLPFGLCVVFGIMFTVLGFMSVKSGKL